SWRTRVAGCYRPVPRRAVARAPSPDVVQALVLEAALLIAVTMSLADLVRAKIDPRAAART
ncbi:MAG: hypothetical protein ACXVFT_21335, partial [Solirubrobacteraceae bacterium]